MSKLSQLEVIYFAALERHTHADRLAYLDSACNDDPNLRIRVEKMLAAQHDAGSFLESPASVIANAASERTDLLRPETERPGTLIGPYKLLEQIGEGGMGLVYMAEQQRPMRRLVALKLIKPGMDSKQVIARFEAEKQALAMMDHENIAKVFEAGTTDTGRFYFAMELVRGIPINEFCDQKRLSVRERLALFIQVCQAVQHAHQKGIIHRDLKPSNVLVTMHDVLAVPKVIDFGIAKALGQQLTEHTLHTGFAQLVGTPLYMSPEQAEMNQLGVDTRSDVYSLGVLLYELLTGTTPFDKETLSKAGLDEMRRMIREDDPLRPSARISTLQAPALSTISQRRSTDPRRISATLRGELDWIVMKALEKDRSRRYESASALATDIQRYLSDEPVLACPPTTMYRFQKFARKHKPALATAAAIALCLLLGTTVSAWQAVRATTAEAQATANAGTAQEKAQEANTQRDEAQKQRDEVRALADRLQRTLYASNMNLAHNAWDAGEIRRVDELLAQHRPEPGEIDLRGFEWHYLYHLCHSDLLTVKTHRNAFSMRNVAYSPDGKRLAFDSPGGVKVCDAQNGQELLTLKGGGRWVVFSPDGKRLACGGGTWDDTKEAFVAGGVKVWDAETGQELLTCKGHTNYVSSVAFSPDGKRLASASNDRTVKVWDAQSGQQLLTLKGNSSSLAFSPDSKRLASAEVGSVKVWDAQTGQELLSFFKEQGRVVTSVAFSPDGKRLASGSGNQFNESKPGELKVWDAQTGQELITFRGHSGWVRSVAFSPDGKRLASAGVGPVRVWDAETGQELFSLKGQSRFVTSVVFSPDGTRLASRGSDGIVKVWNATAGQEARTFSGHTGSVSKLIFSPDGKRMAGVSVDPTTNEEAVKVWDAQTDQELLSLKGHSGRVLRVVFSPDGKRLAAGVGTWDDKKNDYKSGEVKVWDAQTGRVLLTFKGHTAPVVSVVFSPDSTRLASCSSRPNGIGTSDPGEPGEVKVWDAASGAEILTLKGHKRFVNSVTYSPDGKRLATLSRDNTVKVWNAESGQEILTLKVLAHFIGSVAFSPDGKRLASSSTLPDLSGPMAPGVVKVWDAQTGDELLTLKGHTSRISSIVFSPDGKRLASGSGGVQGEGGEIKVWDAQTGQELLTLKGGGLPYNVYFCSVAFSPSGHWLATDAGNAVKIWDATPLPEKP